MIIDIGGGTADIAVLSLGGKVKATSVCGWRATTTMTRS